LRIMAASVTALWMIAVALDGSYMVHPNLGASFWLLPIVAIPSGWLAHTLVNAPLGPAMASAIAAAYVGLVGVIGFNVFASTAEPRGFYLGEIEPMVLSLSVAPSVVIAALATILCSAVSRR